MTSFALPIIEARADARFYCSARDLQTALLLPTSISHQARRCVGNFRARVATVRQDPVESALSVALQHLIDPKTLTIVRVLSGNDRVLNCAEPFD